MDTIQIRSLKSIADSGMIRLRPITIFVGTNSSGKSSLLRTLPLFKQSTESKTLGTILWSGKYVDFGSFNESLHQLSDGSSADEEISFEFNFKIPIRGHFGRTTNAEAPIKFSIFVHGNEYSRESYSTFRYEIFSNSIEIKFDSDLKILNLSINGEDFTRLSNDYFVAHKTYAITPILLQKNRILGKDVSIRTELISELKKYVHHKTSEQSIWKIAHTFAFDDDKSIQKILGNRKIVGSYMANKANEWNLTSPEFLQIKNRLIFCFVEQLIDQVSDYMSAFFLASKYVTPLRAAADRYYRIQNTSIEELDPNGSNLAMFLRGQSDDDIRDLNSWLIREMNFTIQIESSQGHASIFIIDAMQIKSNIADTGFGFSQILPILVQVWHLSKLKRRNHRYGKIPTTLVIEQPELHLHPKMQSKLGEAFCRILKIAISNDIDLRLIIETHSKDVINAIGKCIDKKMFNHEDIAIYLVEKRATPSVVESTFDKNGYLVNWPFGFFDGE